MILRPFFLSLSVVVSLQASEAFDRAHKFEEAGDSVSARQAFSAAIKQTPRDSELVHGYAEFLERYHDSAARAEYRRAATLLKNEGKIKDAAAAQRRAVLLDLIAGDRKSAEVDLDTYKSLGGSDLQLPTPDKTAGQPTAMVTIPGPIRSFARMAAF